MVFSWYLAGLFEKYIFSVQKINIGSDITSLTLETAGVSPCPILPWLFQPARAGSAGQFSRLPDLPGQHKNIQQCATKPVLCWNVCYVFVFYRNGGTRSIGWVLKTAYRSAHCGLQVQVW